MRRDGMIRLAFGIAATIAGAAGPTAAHATVGERLSVPLLLFALVTDGVLWASIRKQVVTFVRKSGSYRRQYRGLEAELELIDDRDLEGRGRLSRSIRSFFGPSRSRAKPAS